MMNKENQIPKKTEQFDFGKTRYLLPIGKEEKRKFNSFPNLQDR